MVATFLGLHVAGFQCFSAFRTQLSRRCPPLVENQAVHVVGEVSEHDLGFGTLDADGPDE